MPTITAAGWRRAAIAARIAIWTINTIGIAAVAAAIAGLYWPSAAASAVFMLAALAAVIAVLFTGARARLAKDEAS